MRYQIAHDKEKGNYYVYDSEPFRMEIGKEYPVIYTGKYYQCLAVVGALSINPAITIDEIRQLSDGAI